MSTIDGLNIDAARREISARFKTAGLDTPELDARVLIGAALNLSHTQLSIQSNRIVTAGEADEIERFARRRIAREPVARILGHKEFWGLNIRVSPATLVPRPDTETVVSAALEFLRNQNKAFGNLRVADIGTGSGAILLALLTECPNAQGIGTDISADALSVAKTNAEKLGLTERTTLIRSNYADSLSGSFDLIVSNPPYIRSNEVGKLEIDVRDYDPHLALDGGADGLDAYRAIAPQSARMLAANGALIVEIGHDQGPEVGDILRTAGLALDAAPTVDLGGRQRVMIGRKPPE